MLRCSLTVILLLACCPDASGQWLLVDADADPGPQPIGGNTGAVFLISADAEITSWFTSPDFVDPVDAAIAVDGSIFILDQKALNAEGGNGILFRIGSGETSPTVFAGAQAFTRPSGLCWAQDGDLIIADADADPVGDRGNTGALFRVNQSGQVSTWVTGDILVDPTRVALEDEGSILLADRTADPFSTGATGALFRVAQDATIGVLSDSPILADPVGVSSLPDGASLLVDRTASVQPEGSTGAVFQFSSQGELMDTFASVLFAEPQYIVGMGGGSFLLVDSAWAGLGGILRIDSAGEVSIWMTDTAFVRPMALIATAPAPIPGDLDHDGTVNLQDLLIFVACFGLSEGTPGTGCTPEIFDDSDLTQDQAVDLNDFLIFAASFE